MCFLSLLTAVFHVCNVIFRAEQFAHHAPLLFGSFSLPEKSVLGCAVSVTSAPVCKQERAPRPFGYFSQILTGDIKMSIQKFSFGSTIVSFSSDAYLNATQIAKHFGKQPRDYLKTQPTQEYISALAENLSIKSKILIDKNQLVITKKGSSFNGGGTWLHPKLAVDFARWLDPKFAVWCDEQIEKILSGNLKLEPVQPALPSDAVVLSKNDVHNLKALLSHLPYMQAYFFRTKSAVRSLNSDIVYKVYDRFNDASFFAGELETSLQLSIPSWRDAYFELD